MSKTRTYTIRHRCGVTTPFRGGFITCRRPVVAAGVRCNHHFLDALPPDRAVTLAAGAIPVDHPAHYNHGAIEAITVIEDWALNFNLGNALKYIARVDHKEGSPLADIKKAIWYLQRELARRGA